MFTELEQRSDFVKDTTVKISIDLIFLIPLCCPFDRLTRSLTIGIIDENNTKDAVT